MIYWLVHHATVDHVTSSVELSLRMTPEARPDLWDEDIDKLLRLVTDTPLTTWSAIHEETL